MTPEYYISTRLPCVGARQFLRKFPTVRTAYDACENIDWLLWFLREEPRTPAVTHAQLRIATRCVRETPLGDGRTVWDLLTDERSRRAVEVAERYAEGRATDQELAAARAAAHVARAVAYHAYAYASADSAAHAAYADFVAYAASAASAASAAYAAYVAPAAPAAYVASSAARSAASAAAHSARVTQLRIIREEIASLDLEPLRD